MVYSTILFHIAYRGALLSTILHVTVYMFLHNLPKVLVQIANKMGLQKKYRIIHRFELLGDR
jgi:hypothetical protein